MCRVGTPSDQGGTLFHRAARMSNDAKGGELPMNNAVPSAGFVLVVDNAASIRSLVRKCLSKAGYSVLEAAHPDAALRIMRESEGEIHLMIIDIFMPGVSGLDLANEVRSQRPGQKILY